MVVISGVMLEGGKNIVEIVVCLILVLLVMKGYVFNGWYK